MPGSRAEFCSSHFGYRSTDTAPPERCQFFSNCSAGMLAEQRKSSEKKLLSPFPAATMLTTVHLKKLPAFLLLGLILCELCPAQPTQLSIDRNAGPARIKVQGETNRDYAVFG